MGDRSRVELLLRPALICQSHDRLVFELICTCLHRLIPINIYGFLTGTSENFSIFDFQLSAEMLAQIGPDTCQIYPVEGNVASKNKALVLHAVGNH